MLASHIEVEFNQSVSLKRNPKILISATTWDSEKIGYAGDSLFVSGTRERISDLVDEFINDYLAANTKEPEKK